MAPTDITSKACVKEELFETYVIRFQMATSFDRLHTSRFFFSLMGTYQVDNLHQSQTLLSMLRWYNEITPPQFQIVWPVGLKETSSNIFFKISLFHKSLFIWTTTISVLFLKSICCKRYLIDVLIFLKFLFLVRRFCNYVSKFYLYFLKCLCVCMCVYLLMKN